jgi:hypothetical protein
MKFVILNNEILKAVNSSIPYNHAGGKYGLADRYPVSYNRSGFFIAEVAEDFYNDPYKTP